MTFLELLQKRRSRYQLTHQMPISDGELEKLIETCIKYAPSAFNSQSARVLLLLGPAHKLLWDLVLEQLRPLTPADHFTSTQEKINSFAAAYATVLFLEDQKVVADLQHQFPAYKHHFPFWSQQSNAMLQFAVWTALAEKGIGASLQHYNPLIDQEVSLAFDLPAHWKLIAQMPLGKAVGEDLNKTFLPMSQRFRVEK